MTISLELHSRVRIDGRQLIQIKINSGKERKRISTEIYVKKTDFKKNKYGRWISDRMTGAKALNIKLEKLLLKHRGLTTPDGKESFVAYANEFARQYDNDNQRGTYLTYKSKIEKLKSYAGESVTFSQINDAFIRKYISHLKKQGNEVNTIAVDLRKIRAIFNQAVREKLVEFIDNPFLNFKIKTERTFKEKLTLEEIEKIRGLDIPESSSAFHTRNIFLFCLNCGGMRIGAALKLKRNQVNDETLVYQADKGGKMKHINLTPEALKIVSFYPKGKYLFPFLEGNTNEFEAVKTKTALINKWLKWIAKKAEINKTISTHVARHSLTKMAIDAGIDMRTLQGILGHSTVAITEHYAGDISDEKSNEALKKIFKS